MSEGMNLGVRSRRIMAIVAVFFAVAVMMAAPLLTVVESDADFTKEEAGYRIEYDDPTDAQLPPSSRGELMMDSLIDYIKVFNIALIGPMTVNTGDSFTLVLSAGQKISSDSDTRISVIEFTSDDVTVSFHPNADGTLINPDIDDQPKELKEAANAIKEEMGNELYTTDLVTFSGKCIVRDATKVVREYGLLEGGKCYIIKETFTEYWVDDIDLTVTLKRDETEKSVKLISNWKGMFESEEVYNYDASPVTAGMHYVKKTTNTYSTKGDVYYTVKDTDYSIVCEVATPDEPGTAELLDQDSIKIVPSLINYIENLPAETDNIKVSKEYSDAESAYNSVEMAAVGDDILKIILIGLGIFFGILVLIAVILVLYFVLRKKRK